MFAILVARPTSVTNNLPVLSALVWCRRWLGSQMKKGVHPALQWIRIISPHGRLVRVLAAKAFKLDRPTYVRDPGKQSETVGTLAKFRRRFEFAPKASSAAASASESASSASSGSPSS